MNDRMKRVTFLLVRLLLAAGIILYYWNYIDGLEVKQVPILVMILAMAYIAVQIIKRMILKEQAWYDWVYYIGLCSILLPVILTNDSNSILMNTLADVGVLFFIVPLLLEGQALINQKS